MLKHLISTIKKILKSKLGVDKAIGVTVLGRTIQALGSIVTIALISLFLSKNEQGYYYTFGSIIAIQIFFELGFSGIIGQYAAHEFAHVNSLNATLDDSEKKAQSRLSSLLRFCLKWFSILSAALFIALLTAGFFFFSKYNVTTEANWKVPWILLVVNTCISFLISPFFSFIEGLGKVKEIAQLRLYQQAVYLACLWLMLLTGGKLYSAPIAGIVSFAVILCIFLWSDLKTILIKIWRLKDQWTVDYKNEIFPYQWKIAVSWISGYFIFQIFNPVLFATEGAVVAGQMGMTLAALNGVSGLSMSWITTKVPTFSTLFARSDYSSADQLFNKTMKQVLILTTLGVIAIISIITGLRIFNIHIADRFLPTYLIALMGLSVCLNQLVFSWATYLRCHKKEPYMLASIVGAIAISSSIFLFGKLYGAKGLVICYVTVVALMKFWEYQIFVTSKRKWHG
jgi:hypothetical protein